MSMEWVMNGANTQRVGTINHGNSSAESPFYVW
jgi:hypothetical protein